MEFKRSRLIMISQLKDICKLVLLFTICLIVIYGLTGNHPALNENVQTHRNEGLHVGFHAVIEKGAIKNTKYVDRSKEDSVSFKSHSGKHMKMHVTRHIQRNPFNDNLTRIGPKPMKIVVPNEAVRMDKMVVPKIVHLVWFYSIDHCNLRFHQYLTLLSVHKFVKPDRIIFWNNNPPCGKWWINALNDIPELETRHMEAPTHIFGQEIRLAAHKADVARLRIVLEHGGIYIDNDLVALDSWDALLHFETSMAAETTEKLANGFIVSVANATFLHYWLGGYRTYHADNWTWNSLKVPMMLAKIYPKMIHVEWDTIIRPTYIDNIRDTIMFKEGKLFDWSRNYAMHLYYRYHNKEHNPEDIKEMNTTMGEVFRYIFYGTTKLLD